jgi:DNA-binding response OmpR family regulator
MVVVEGVMGMRFLVIDEHWCSRTAMRLALVLKGYRCVDVACAREALLAVESFAPEVALLEWDFRDGSGLGLARRLRRRAAASGRSLIIIATSATHDTLAVHEREQLDAYLVKPASIFEIETTLATILEDPTRPYPTA